MKRAEAWAMFAAATIPNAFDRQVPSDAVMEGLGANRVTEEAAEIADRLLTYWEKRFPEETR